MSRVVVKIGGRAAAGAAAAVRASLDTGAEVVVVHGAGPQISAAMEAAALEVRFVGGRRVTTPAALAVVRAELARVNAAVTAALGARAVGLMGDEIGLRAEHVPELGSVGVPLPSAPAAVAEALAAGRIPVVAPLAVGPLNVNADDAAAALAAGLGADRILFVSDVPGVLLDGGVVAALSADDADRMVASGTLAGGIAPKVAAAARAARLGIRAEIGGTAVLAAPA